MLEVMAGPELSVVCRNCGSEVSPYVTECPYCGNASASGRRSWSAMATRSRIREGRREKKLRRAAERASTRRRALRELRPRIRSSRGLATRPWATALLLRCPAVLFIASQASDELLLGRLDKTYRARVAALPDRPVLLRERRLPLRLRAAIAIFLPPIERRIGSVPALILALACGAPRDPWRRRPQLA